MTQINSTQLGNSTLLTQLSVINWTSINMGSPSTCVLVVYQVEWTLQLLVVLVSHHTRVSCLLHTQTQGTVHLYSLLKICRFQLVLQSTTVVSNRNKKGFLSNTFLERLFVESFNIEQNTGGLKNHWKHYDSFMIMIMILFAIKINITCRQKICKNSYLQMAEWGTIF